MQNGHLIALDNEHFTAQNRWKTISDFHYENRNQPPTEEILSNLEPWDILQHRPWSQPEVELAVARVEQIRLWTTKVLQVRYNARASTPGTINLEATASQSICEFFKTINIVVSGNRLPSTDDIWQIDTTCEQQLESWRAENIQSFLETRDTQSDC